MKKRHFFIIFLVMFVTSCIDDQTESISDTNISTDKVNIDEEDLLEKEWQILKQAIINKNKPVVMTFVSNEDLLLKEAIDLSYDYIFDDEMITFIMNKSYSNLNIAIEGMNKNSDSKIESEDKKFIHFEKSYDIELDTLSTSIAKSGITIELSEINESLKITNYNTFHNVIEN